MLAISMEHMPVTKSFLDAEALAERIEHEYRLVDVRCQLITATMRDVYLVTSDQGRYVLFVYRHGQRSAEEIADSNSRRLRFETSVLLTCNNNCERSRSRAICSR